MELLNQYLLIGAFVLLTALVLGALSSRLGLPLLLVFLLVGMLAGEDGFGGIAFDDYRLSFLVGNIALAVILLDGGLRTRIGVFRVALRPALTLATLGVVVTAVLVAACAAWIFDLSWVQAALLGAIVGSTDAAAVFSLLKSAGVRISDRVAATLEAESGANDPMAVFLTITLIDIALAPTTPQLSHIAIELLRAFGIGALFGGAGGWLAARALALIRIGSGLDALLLCAIGVSIFSCANAIGGSGFLAVYLAGVVAGNARVPISDTVLRTMDGMAWLAQSGMFLLLGLLVHPSQLWSVLFPALMVSIFLIVIARPLAVWLCLLPFRFRPREVAYVSWVGLRGAVPIVLGMFPLFADVPGALLLFDVAFVVVLISLLAQGMTVGISARWLGVSLPPRAEPRSRMQLSGSSGGHELVEFVIAPRSAVPGRALEQLKLPSAARPVSVMRDGLPLAPAAAGPLCAGDIVALIAPDAALARLEDIFLTDADRATDERQRAFGEFLFAADAPATDVFALYGIALPAGLTPETTLGGLIAERLPTHPVEGDSVRFDEVVLTVAEMDGNRLRRIGLHLPRDRVLA